MKTCFHKQPKPSKFTRIIVVTAEILNKFKHNVDKPTAVQ
jgi:hypothetical protein